MSLLLTILTTTFIMGIMIALGVLIGRKLTITFEAKQLLMTIIINIAIPSIILNGIFNTEITDSLLTDMILIFLLSIVLNLLGIGLGLIAAKIGNFHSLEARKIAILAGLGNTGFIGIPLCAEIFGPVGGLLAAVFDSGLDFVVFSFAIILLQDGGGYSLNKLKALINIPFIAILLGVLVALTGFQPPFLLKSLASYLSSLATPLAMIYIGLLVQDYLHKKNKVPTKLISITLLMKLLFFPLIGITALQVTPLSLTLMQISYIQLAMPTFTLSTVLLAKYTNDEDSALVVVIYSTLLSLVTIPFVIYLADFLI